MADSKYWNKPYRVPIGFIDTTTTNGITSTNSNNSLNAVGNSVKSGNSVPGYIELMKAGIGASSAYVREEYIIKPLFYTMASHLNSPGLVIRSNKTERLCHTGVLPNVSFDSSLVVNEASARLKRKLRDVTGSSNQLTNVAELREMPKTIRAVADSALKLVAIVATSKKRGKDLKNFASDAWLTWSFGISPTLGAADDAIKSVQSYLDRQDHAFREYGIHNQDWLSSTSSTTGGSYGHNVLLRGSFTHHLSAKLVAGYRYSLRSSENYTPGKHLGFDISSVVPTAYELLPFSWLLDYFTTAGSFIEDTFAADFGMQSIYICQNTRITVKGQVTARPQKVIALSGSDFWNTQPLEFDYFKLTRSPLSNLPRAPLRFKNPDEIATNAINKLLNLTSILGSKK